MHCRMPTSSPRPCRECRTGLTRARDGLCDLCRAKRHKQYDARRRAGLATDNRYYRTAAWRTLRDAHMQIEPLCRRCKALGLVVEGYGVNHIVPRAQGGSDSHDNLETLCKGHMTSADPRGVVKTRIA